VWNLIWLCLSSAAGAGCCIEDAGGVESFFILDINYTSGCNESILFVKKSLYIG
jgi:hypothetical protein